MTQVYLVVTEPYAEGFYVHGMFTDLKDANELRGELQCIRSEEVLIVSSFCTSLNETAHYC